MMEMEMEMEKRYIKSKNDILPLHLFRLLRRVSEKHDSPTRRSPKQQSKPDGCMHYLTVDAEFAFFFCWLQIEMNNTRATRDARH